MQKCRHKFKFKPTGLLVPQKSYTMAPLAGCFQYGRGAVRQKRFGRNRSQFGSTEHVTVSISKVLAEKRVRIIVSLIIREWWFRVRARGSINVSVSIRQNEQRTNR